MERIMVSTDQLEQRTLARRAEMSRLQAEELLDLEELDYRQVATADGCHSMAEWVAGRLDLSTDSAKSLVRTMRRTQDRPDLRKALESGVSFDRIEALAMIPDKIGLLEHLDVGGVTRVAASRARITAEDEQRTFDEQFLVMQPSLDQSWWKLWGGLDGVSGALVDKALSVIADELSEHSQGDRMPSNWYRAAALTQLCVTDTPPPAHVTVHVDANHAAGSRGETSVVLEAGPNIGRQALEAILCEATVEVTARAKTASPCSTDEGPGRSHQAYAGSFSTAMDMSAEPTDVPASIDSKSTTSFPGARAEPPTPTNSSPSAGTTIRSSSTSKDSPPTVMPSMRGSDLPGPGRPATPPTGTTLPDRTRRTSMAPIPAFEPNDPDLSHKLSQERPMSDALTLPPASQ